MKKLILLLLITTLSYAQETFIFNKDGFTDYVVTNVAGTQSELFSKTNNWIKENYKSPDDVIKMTMENEKIRIQGYKQDFYCVPYGKQQICSNATYMIEISFKDGKYKFDPLELSLSNSAGSYPMDMTNTSKFYNKKGEIVKGSERTPKILEDFFNGLNESLKSYISGGSKDDKW